MRAITLAMLTAAALLAAPSPQARAASEADGAKRISRCLLEVDGRRYIDGPCLFAADDGGSFTISTIGTLRYFAVLDLSDDGARAFWNEEQGAGHAHTPLGPMVRRGACWRNRSAKICAWR